MEGDEYSFEMIGGTSQGELYHGCYEVDKRNKTISSFKPMRKLLSGKMMGHSQIMDIKILKRVKKAVV